MENITWASNTWVSSKEFGSPRKHLATVYLLRKATDSPAEAYVEYKEIFVSFDSVFQIQNHESLRMLHGLQIN